MEIILAAWLHTYLSMQSACLSALPTATCIPRYLGMHACRPPSQMAAAVGLRPPYVGSLGVGSQLTLSGLVIPLVCLLSQFSMSPLFTNAECGYGFSWSQLESIAFLYMPSCLSKVYRKSGSDIGTYSLLVSFRDPSNTPSSQQVITKERRSKHAFTMSSSSVDSGVIFRVDGIVAIITGGGTGKPGILSTCSQG